MSKFTSEIKQENGKEVVFIHNEKGELKARTTIEGRNSVIKILEKDIITEHTERKK